MAYPLAQSGWIGYWRNPQVGELSGERLEEDNEMLSTLCRKFPCFAARLPYLLPLLNAIQFGEDRGRIFQLLSDFTQSGHLDLQRLA